MKEDDSLELVDFILNKKGIFGVILLRVMPIPPEICNYLLRYIITIQFITLFLF